MVELKVPGKVEAYDAQGVFQSVYGRIERQGSSVYGFTEAMFQSVYGRIERPCARGVSFLVGPFQSVYGRIERALQSLTPKQVSPVSIGLW